MHVVHKETFLPRFSGNYEASTSDFQENLEEMFPCNWYLLVDPKQMTEWNTTVKFN